jgi:hypothetical protein
VTDLTLPDWPPDVPVRVSLSGGDEALELWRQRRAESAGSGYWPVLMEPGGVGTTPKGPAAVRLSQVDSVDVVALLNKGGGMGSVDPGVRQEWLDGWPEEPERIERFRLPYARGGAPDPTYVALVEAGYGWQIPVLAGFGGWNECPEPAVHGAVLRHWGERYGLELVCFAESSLEFLVNRPPRTQDEALAFAWEYATYSPDSVDALYYADTLADLAGSLLDAPIVVAWWD